ncbi:hypothetical protein AABB24_036827 [Solanum stoloniferum]
MDQVDFEPAQNWNATILRGVDHHPESKQPMSDVFKPPILLRSGGGIHNFLYRLKLSSDGSQLPKVEGSNVLGKLQITWRTNLGEPGRLQTQQILGSPITQKDIELRAVEVPSIIMLEKPFVVRLNLANQTDRVLGPFEVWVSQSDSLDEKAIMVNGLLTMLLAYGCICIFFSSILNFSWLQHLAQVEAFSSSEFELNLIAVKHGVQKITGITVFDTREKKTYDSLLELEVFVDSQ